MQAKDEKREIEVHTQEVDEERNINAGDGWGEGDQLQETYGEREINVQETDFEREINVEDG